MCILCAAVWLPAGCGSASGLDAAIADYADAQITVAGLTETEFTISPSELAELDCVSSSASGQTAKAGTVSAAGPTLETFLEQYGKTQTDFALARFIASDGYRVTLHIQSLEKYEIILSVASGDKPLPESERPLRLLIPGAESSQWIYAVERIEFEAKK
ncbi:MAG: molybdopterin-dependent oxidoreductase [Peptococcaceae bacterium]|nr:molybdopterin-dependent oxidoreductase [Peptococcaceae bacterium]